VGNLLNPAKEFENKEIDGHYQDVINFQEEKKKRQGRVGNDRQRKFDDVFASSVNTGTKN